MKPHPIAYSDEFERVHQTLISLLKRVDGHSVLLLDRDGQAISSVRPEGAFSEGSIEVEEFALRLHQSTDRSDRRVQWVEISENYTAITVLVGTSLLALIIDSSKDLERSILAVESCAPDIQTVLGEVRRKSESWDGLEEL